MILHIKKDQLSSDEIKKWLGQFDTSDRFAAGKMLLQLEFISNDSFSYWITSTIEKKFAEVENFCALYSIRKLTNQTNKLVWDENGQTINRSSKAQGSEEIIYALIGQITKRNKNRFLDNPSIMELRENKVREIVLVTDSIGSGDQIAGYIKAMFLNKTFKSWWSLGLTRIHIISYLRFEDANVEILRNISGENYKKKYPKKDRVKFYANRVLHKSCWHDDPNVHRLIEKYDHIPEKYRKGIGKCMSNVIFFHTVPNNIPGILFFKSKKGGRKWVPLFRDRTLDNAIIKLLNYQNLMITKPTISSGEILVLIKKGIRKPTSIAFRLNCEVDTIGELLSNLKISKLVTPELYLTKAGEDFVKSNVIKNYIAHLNYRLYTPKTWRTGY